MRIVNRACIATALCLFATGAFAARRFDFTSYNPLPISEIIKKHGPELLEPSKNTPDKEINANLSTETIKYRAPFTYKAKQRPTPYHIKEGIRLWNQARGIEDDQRDPYNTEILVSDEDKLYWIPIKNTLLSSINRKIRKDDSVDLFLVLAGAVNGDLVFLCTEIQKTISSGTSP